MMRVMTLEQLRVFVAVAERQHVTRAADALNLTQSAVSAAIAALESRHETKLFNRVGRGIELTDAGKLFLSEAKAILTRVEAAELALAEFSGLKSGTLSVNASQTIASYWLPRYLVAFRRAYPGIDVRLSIGNSAQVAAAIHAGTADLGFVEGEVLDPALVSRPVARDQMIVVVGADHPWASRKIVKAAEIADTEWVLREQGSGTRSVFEQALTGLGVRLTDLRIAMELPSNEAVRAAVEAGMGATGHISLCSGAKHRSRLAARGGPQTAGPPFLRTPSRRALSQSGGRSSCRAHFAKTTAGLKRSPPPAEPSFRAGALVSRPVGFHRQPLAEPDVRLSPHPAPIKHGAFPYRIASVRRVRHVPGSTGRERATSGLCAP